MRKPLAGKRWFYSLGQREKARGHYLYSPSYLTDKRGWPAWAATAYLDGYMGW